MEGGDREKLIEIQSKAFNMFDEGKLPIDLVKEGVCTSEEAISLFKEYGDTISSGQENIGQADMIEDLATQIGLLGSRVARIELQLLNALLLPKRIKCASCGHQGSYGVGIICGKCGEVNAYREDDMERLLPSTMKLEAYRPWEDEGDE